MESDRVRDDLRRLRKITHSIEAEMRSKELNEKRLELLKRNEDKNKDEIAKIEGILRCIRLEEHIARASELEQRYMDAINALEEPLDRAIILRGYVNGEAYWKIARDIGYTEDGIKKRVKKIIDKIAKML